MSEDRVKYKKRKYMYLIQDEGRSKRYLFGNIRSMCRWFDAQELTGSRMIDSYERVVHCLRSGKQYGVSFQGCMWSIRAVEVIGQKVNSSRKRRDTGRPG